MATPSPIADPDQGVICRITAQTLVFQPFQRRPFAFTTYREARMPPIVHPLTRSDRWQPHLMYLTILGQQTEVYIFAKVTASKYTFSCNVRLVLTTRSHPSLAGMSAIWERLSSC